MVEEIKRKMRDGEIGAEDAVDEVIKIYKPLTMKSKIKLVLELLREINEDAIYEEFPEMEYSITEYMMNIGMADSSLEIVLELLETL